MRKPPCSQTILLSVILPLVVVMSGCSTVGSATADLGLAGAGAVVGYQVSDKKAAGAAAGAVAGYLAAKATKAEVQKALTEAEQRGFDRALNQAVKQQYWIIQNQQRSRETPEETEPRLVPVVIPETTINGVVQAAHVEYLRL
jgi:uncharacterized protein YceK